MSSASAGSAVSQRAHASAMASTEPGRSTTVICDASGSRKIACRGSTRAAAISCGSNTSSWSRKRIQVPSSRSTRLTETCPRFTRTGRVGASVKITRGWPISASNAVPTPPWPGLKRPGETRASATRRSRGSSPAW